MTVIPLARAHRFTLTFHIISGAFADMYNQQARKRGNSIGGSSIKPAADGVDWNPSENVWSEEFLQNAAATFESNMATLLGTLKGTSDDSSITQEQVVDTFKMMAGTKKHYHIYISLIPPLKSINTTRGCRSCYETRRRFKVR